MVEIDCKTLSLCVPQKFHQFVRDSVFMDRHVLLMTTPTMVSVVGADRDLQGNCVKRVKNFCDLTSRIYTYSH